MKVDSLDSLSPIRKLKQKKQTSALGFALPYDDAEEEVDSIVSAPKIPSLNPFLALQEVEDYDYDSSDNQKLLSESNTLISFLDQIRHGLINGDLNIQNIKSLKEVIERSRHKFASLEAQALYDEIYLRASVELAKLERSQKDKSPKEHL
ncbi:MAG: flagellar assembly protein FliX [Rickettsiaceae bacterium]|jgi:hypothetical protein|nr:flagellar assembly protein FliX [Rickettsiaceae bacterium]